MLELTLNTPAVSATASGFLRLGKSLQQSIDRKLGYAGKDRFVLFYYEPRGHEVMWQDGRTYGFGHGGWQAFYDEVEPLASLCGINLSDGERPGEHVLIVDRSEKQAYFADRKSAKALVARQEDSLLHSMSA